MEKPKKCEYCKKEFIGDYKKRFCSPKCASRKRNKQHKPRCDFSKGEVYVLVDLEGKGELEGWEKQFRK